jgi:uncharacterized OB-fold protein
VAIGLVRPDGADAAIVHRIVETGDEPLEIGQHMEVVVKPEEERTGSIHDIAGFRPTG